MRQWRTSSLYPCGDHFYCLFWNFMLLLFWRTHLSNTSSNVKSKSFFFVLGKKTSFLSDLSELAPRKTSRTKTRPRTQNAVNVTERNIQRSTGIKMPYEKDVQNWFWSLTMLLMKNTKERKGRGKELQNWEKNALNNQPLEPSTSFSSAAVKSRSVKKVEKSLPKSPRKKGKSSQK